MSQTAGTSDRWSHRENLPGTEVEALDPQDFGRLIQAAAKRWGPLRLKQLRAFVLGRLRWCLEDEGLIELMPRTGSLKTPKVVAKPKETYTPEEIRTLFNDLDSCGRSLRGLGQDHASSCRGVVGLGTVVVGSHRREGRRQRVAEPLAERTAARHGSIVSAIWVRI